MTIPLLYPDNPISMGDLPDQPLTVQLPAHGAVISEGETRSLSRILMSAMAHILCAMCGVGLIVSLAKVEPRLTADWVYPFESAGIFVLALAILIRPLIPNYLYALPLIAVAHATALIVLVSAIAGQGATHGKALGVLLAELFMLIAMEIGFHFYVLFQATSELAQTTENVNDRPYRRLLVVSGIAMFSMAALANSTIPLLGIWMVVLTVLAVAMAEATQRFKKPSKAIRYHLIQYFLYPIPSDLAPGLARSPAGHYFLRTALLAIPVATLTRRSSQPRIWPTPMPCPLSSCIWTWRGLPTRIRNSFVPNFAERACMLWKSSVGWLLTKRST